MDRSTDHTINNRSMSLDSNDAPKITDVEENSESYKHTQLIAEYYALSTQESIDRKDGMRIQEILEQSELDDNLAFSLNLVDEIIYQELGYLETSSLCESELIRAASLERIFSNFEELVPLPHREAPSNRVFHLIKRYRWALIAAAISVWSIVLAEPIREISSLPFETLGEISSRQSNVQGVHPPSSPSSGKNHSKEYKSCPTSLVKWIDPSLEGNTTAYGQEFRNEEDVAAHDFFPPGTEVVIEKDNTKLKVEITDKSSAGTGLVVSEHVANKLNIIESGKDNVKLVSVKIEKSGKNNRNYEPHQARTLAYYTKNVCKKASDHHTL